MTDKNVKKTKIMAKKAIPDSVKARVREIVEQFNQTELNTENKGVQVENLLSRFRSYLGLNTLSDSGPSVYYTPRFRGKFMYLDRTNHGRSGPICRLEYNGKIDNWDFAIYKYSRERYDPDEWFFPGTEHLDGTIAGAMRAGLEAYPP